MRAVWRPRERVVRSAPLNPMAPSFLLDLQDLDAAGKSLQQPIPVAWMQKAFDGLQGEVDASDKEGRVDVRYSRSGTDLIIHGRVQAEVQVPCSRCLQAVRLPIDTELSLLLVPASSAKAGFARGKQGGPGAKKKKPAATDASKAVKKEKPAKTRPARGEADEYEIQPGDADFDVYEGDKVALDPFMREALLLEVPPFVLCSEDCRGIAPPPPSGEDTDQEASSIDPRLAPLLRFKKPGSL